jgi:hypothetical protein
MRMCAILIWPSCGGAEEEEEEEEEEANVRVTHGETRR